MKCWLAADIIPAALSYIDPILTCRERFDPLRIRPYTDGCSPLIGRGPGRGLRMVVIAVVAILFVAILVATIQFAAIAFAAILREGFPESVPE